MKRLLLTLVLLSVGSAYAATPTPNPELENTDLVRINTILNALYPLIDEAQANQDMNQRVIFNYAALRGDVQLIQAGIAQKINGVSLVPRTITPLQNDFLDNQATPGAKQ